jgi:nicotinamide mononucleotide (NMN) deamidase PncC
MAAPANATLLNLVRRLAGRLLGGNKMLATAESCTGGLIAKCITDRREARPGSSGAG